MVFGPKLDFDFVFSKIDYVSVYARELPGVGLKQAICSPLRRDVSPSLMLTIGQSGQMRHIDMAYPDDNRFSGGAVDFVMARYGLNSFEALKKIAQDFCLLEKNSGRFEEIKRTIIKPIMDIKRTCLIQIEARKWNRFDKEEWEQYLIPIKMCQEEEIYPVKELFVNRTKVPMKMRELVYAYRRPKGFQIYFCQRKKSEGRWLSNTPLTDVRHLENLSSNNNSLIVPSLKCYMVCKQIYPHLCNIKNESMGSLTPEIAKSITENSKKVFYGGNCDVPGKVASYKITTAYSWNHINPPDYLLPKYTDWSDWSRRDQSLKGIESHFLKKGLMI